MNKINCVVAALVFVGGGAANAQTVTNSPVFGTVLDYPTEGCGGAVLQVPLPGHVLLPKTAIISASGASFYARAAARHVKWSTSMRCTHTGITHVLDSSPMRSDSVSNDANSAGVFNGYISNNWSGYQVANTAQYTESGWTIPTVVLPNPAYGNKYYSSTWTGIGGGFGAGTGPLIQSGSSQFLVQGVTDYYFWYEIVNGATDTGGEVEISSMPANPGDAAGSASIWTPDPDPNYPGVGEVTLGACDFSQGSPSCTNFLIDSGNYSTPTPGNTVEWIVEAPSVGGYVQPLADFDQVTFVNACWAATYIGPTSTCYSISDGVSPHPIVLQQYVLGANQTLTHADALNGSGTGFTDYYLQPTPVGGGRN